MGNENGVVGVGEGGGERNGNGEGRRTYIYFCFILNTVLIFCIWNIESNDDIDRKQR